MFPTSTIFQMTMMSFMMVLCVQENLKKYATQQAIDTTFEIRRLGMPASNADDVASAGDSSEGAYFTIVRVTALPADDISSADDSSENEILVWLKY